jgi:hypothetical protein
MTRSGLLVALLLVSCADLDEEPALACADSAIVGGGPTSMLGDSEALRRGVVGILVDHGSGSFAGLCSGVLVSPRSVLTAAHCFGPRAAHDDTVSASLPKATVVFVGGQGFAPREVDVRGVSVHPELDLALLELERRNLAEVFAAPLPLHLEALDDSWVGATVELAGFGASEVGALGHLAFVTEQVVRLEPDHVVVDGRGQTGACVGDSGGPLLGRTSAGRSEVLALLDAGSASCTGEDFYTRLDRVASWGPLVRALASVGHGCSP